MTDQELKDLVARLAIDAERRSIEADKRHAETERQLKKLGKLIGNIGNNQGDIAKEFFYRSFKKHPVLNNIHFDNVTRQLKNCVKRIEDEYDIVLINRLVVIKNSYKIN